MKIPQELRYLRPVDAVIIAFTGFLSIIIVVFLGRIGDWGLILSINVIACVGLIALAQATAGGGRAFYRRIHDWYPALAIFLLFKEVYIIIQSLGRRDWDDLLIAADRAIFGVHPTIWLSHFSSPGLTELLEVAYASYYFIMLAAGIELYVRHEREKFSYLLFLLLYGFVLSYLGYLVFPAVGPRFTLHNFSALDTDLPGLYFTNAIREFLNAGESIPTHAANAIAFAQRDAFPSGHTQMTLITLVLAHRYRLRSRYVLTLFGTLLIISTVYLRYHYVVDVAGGVAFMGLTLWTGPKIFRWWERFKMREAS